MTWILCTRELAARVYQWKNHDEGIRFFKEILPPPNLNEGSSDAIAVEEFDHYVAEEMEVACGAGTFSHLIVCGKPDVVHRVLSCLSTEVEARVIGIIKHDLYDVGENDLLNYALEFAPEVEDATEAA